LIIVVAMSALPQRYERRELFGCCVPGNCCLCNNDAEIGTLLKATFTF